MYYHGTTDALGLTYRLLPPSVHGNVQEAGRKKNLDRVFFTTDLGSAKIYAGRACRRFGGNPVVYRVIPMDGIVQLNGDDGTSVYHSGWAFLEPLPSGRKEMA